MSKLRWQNEKLEQEKKMLEEKVVLSYFNRKQKLDGINSGIK